MKRRKSIKLLCQLPPWSVPSAGIWWWKKCPWCLKEIHKSIFFTLNLIELPVITYWLISSLPVHVVSIQIGQLYCFLLCLSELCSYATEPLGGSRASRALWFCRWRQMLRSINLRIQKSEVIAVTKSENNMTASTKAILALVLSNYLKLLDKQAVLQQLWNTLN